MPRGNCATLSLHCAYRFGAITTREDEWTQTSRTLRQSVRQKISSSSSSSSSSSELRQPFVHWPSELVSAALACLYRVERVTRAVSLARVAAQRGPSGSSAVKKSSSSVAIRLKSRRTSYLHRGLSQGGHRIRIKPSSFLKSAHILMVQWSSFRTRCQGDCCERQQAVAGLADFWAQNLFKQETERMTDEREPKLYQLKQETQPGLNVDSSAAFVSNAPVTEKHGPSRKDDVEAEGVDAPLSRKTVSSGLSSI